MTGHRKRPHNVVLLGVVGSTAYGLAGPGSDVDRRGVYVEDTEELLGLDASLETWEAAKDEPDEVLHELAKFCRLGLKVNPTATELLWLPEELYDVLTPIGEQLIALRHHFLWAERARGAYLGYARDQFDKLERRGDGAFSSDLRKRTSRDARHIAILLHQGFALWATGTLPVRLVDPEPQWYLEFGERVADGEIEEARTLIAEFTEKFDATPTALPNEPNRDVVDHWLRRVRVDLID